MFSIRSRHCAAHSASRRVGPCLETLEDRTTPAHRFVVALSQPLDASDEVLSLREAPPLTAEAIFHQYIHRIYNLAR